MLTNANRQQSNNNTSQSIWRFVLVIFHHFYDIVTLLSLSLISHCTTMTVSTPRLICLFSSLLAFLFFIYSQCVEHWRFLLWHNKKIIRSLNMFLCDDINFCFKHRSRQLSFLSHKKKRSVHCSPSLGLFLSLSSSSSPAYTHSFQFISILFSLTGWRKNTDAVLQVVELCLKLDIALSDMENKKFLNLMLRRPSTEKKTKKIIAIEKYQFKFWRDLKGEENQFVW